MVKMKKLLNLQFGNKGYIVSLDICIALFIIVITLIVSLFLISRTNEDNLSLAQQTKLADDIVSVLDYNKKFDSLNKNTISSNINYVLPKNYDMRFRIECKNKIIQNLINNTNNFIASSERVIVTDNLEFCKLRYWLWSKWRREFFILSGFYF